MKTERDVNRQRWKTDRDERRREMEDRERWKNDRDGRIIEMEES